MPAPMTRELTRPSLSGLIDLLDRPEGFWHVPRGEKCS